MPTLPTGTVTFLFTDVEGNTQLWERHPEAMRTALAHHDAVLRDAVTANHGHLVKTTGDGLHAVFATALDAILSALAGQRALQSMDWGMVGGLRVRMAIHTGGAELRDGDYYGPAVNRAARLTAAAHGGQILLSLPTAELVRDALSPDIGLKNLGEHRLKDLTRPEHVFQLVVPDLPAEFPPLKTLDTHPNNLPLQLTSFVGREREMAEVKRLLQSPTGSRLLTLIGPGGAGKTRLSLQVAADLLAEYPDGAWFVELAPLADATLVPQTVAMTLSVREEASQSVLATLIAALKTKRLLLVLDNCEHLVEAVARVADSLLRGCPSVQILATSREPLGVAGETAWPVPSLALPDPRRLSSAEQLRSYAGVQLFVERAASALPSFTLTEQNARALVEVCHRLDGIPLAIELAAARVRLLTVEQILTRLDDRFRLLATGSRAAMPRHQTLRALVDWSYGLLSEREQIAFNRLAVFAGGWSLDAAEAVCAGEGVGTGEVLDLMARLVDKSLVLVEAGSSENARYRLLETLRQYAWERLAERGETSSARVRHAAYYFSLAEQAEPFLERPEMARWLDHLEQEHDNLRAALRWLRECRDAERGLRMASALRLFWFLRGHLTEGRERITELLSLGSDVAPTVRAKVLDVAGFLARMQGDHPAAEALISESLAVWRALGNRQGIVDALCNLGYVHLFRGEYAQARSLYQESLAVNRAVENQQGIADALSHLGLIAFFQNDFDTARSMHAESLTIWKTLGDRQGVAWALYKLGDIALHSGDLAQARALFSESLMIRREINDQWGTPESLEGFAALAAARNHSERALKLAGAAARLHEAASVVAGPMRQAALDQWLLRARRALRDDVAAAAWAAGRSMALDEAVALALSDEEPAPTPPPTTPIAASSKNTSLLTPREREVAICLARGLTNRQIAAELVISERTAERHVENILAKLSLASRTHVAVWATEQGLLASSG